MITLIVAYGFYVSVTGGQKSYDFAAGEQIVVERGRVLHRGADCPLARRELVSLLRDGVVVKQKV